MLDGKDNNKHFNYKKYLKFNFFEHSLPIINITYLNNVVVVLNKCIQILLYLLHKTSLLANINKLTNI